LRLRSIIEVGQALSLDCFKVKGTTVPEPEACVIAKHRHQIAAGDIKRPGAA
jgi:hypothetical protein